MSNQIDHSLRGHAKVSPSQLNNRSACEGWLPERNKQIHPVTAEGTRCHEALETGDDSLLESEWEERHVATCREYLEILPDAEVQSIEPLIEILGGRTWGYADLVRLDRRVNPESSDLVDYKFGYNPVKDSSENLQVIAYALGLFEKYPTLKEITAHLLMARLGKVSIHTFKRSEYTKLKQIVQEVLDKAENPDPANFNVSYSNCVYCDRKGTCPALEAHTNKVLKRKSRPSASQRTTVKTLHHRT